MMINAKGLALVKHFEGLFLKAYLDPVGVWTIGYGHTATAKKGMTISEKEAEALLVSDLENHEKYVKKSVDVTLNSDQFSALVSFAFNVGNGALGSSTLLKRLNDGKMKQAAEQFGAWVKGTIGGKKVTLPGLVRRRESERKLFADGLLDFGYGPVDIDDGAADAEEGVVSKASAPIPAAPATLEDEFTQEFNSWGIKHFKAFELLVKGSQHSQPSSPAYGLNTSPPKSLWKNIRPTILVLDKFRQRIGSPIQTLSVYRSPPYNTAIGGAGASQHMLFNAIDFHVKGTSLHPAQWASMLQEMKADGDFDGWIGTYTTFVHVDTRNDI